MIKLNYISSTTSPPWGREVINTTWGRDVKLLQPGRRREEHPEKAEQVFCTDDCFSKYTFQFQLSEAQHNKYGEHNLKSTCRNNSLRIWFMHVLGAKLMETVKSRVVEGGRGGLHYGEYFQY